MKKKKRVFGWHLEEVMFGSDFRREEGDKGRNKDHTHESSVVRASLYLLI